MRPWYRSLYDTCREHLSAQIGSRVSATMRDVAELANVSAMTVSRVLSGAPGVAPATAQAVMDAVKKTQYRRNELARSLRPGQKSNMIALVIGDIANPFYAVLALSVEQFARQRGYVTVIFNTNEDPEGERRGLSDLLARHVDGVLLVSCDDDHAYLANDMAAGTGFVFVDRPAVGIAADEVLIDNRSGVRAATTELIRRGHKRVGYIGDYERLFTAAERLTGHLGALADAQLGQDDALVQMGVHTLLDAASVAERWLTSEQPPTAIVGANNLLAAGAARAIARIAPATTLIGFDHLPESQMSITVGYDVTALGTMAATLLLDRLDGLRDTPVREVLPTTLDFAEDSTLETT